jgi:hypothetical protein
MPSREQIEKFRDENPDLASIPQMALDLGPESPMWDHVGKLIAMYAGPEMTEREYNQRSKRWTNSTALSDPEMAERLRGQLQGYEMSLFRFSQFSFRRAIEITRGELASLELLITSLTEQKDTS